MPPVCRRIFALLAVACLGAVAHVSPALAQGAGDQQYQDPFGDTGSGSSGSGTKTTTAPSLSATPQGSAGTSGSGAGSGTSGAAATPAPAPAQAGSAQSLPNTGTDARVLLLGGAALLLLGVGLRLRSAPERF